MYYIYYEITEEYIHQIIRLKLYANNCHENFILVKFLLYSLWWGELCTSMAGIAMLAGVCIHLVGPPQARQVEG